MNQCCNQDNYTVNVMSIVNQNVILVLWEITKVSHKLRRNSCDVTLSSVLLTVFFSLD